MRRYAWFVAFIKANMSMPLQQFCTDLHHGIVYVLKINKCTRITAIQPTIYSHMASLPEI